MPDGSPSTARRRFRGAWSGAVLFLLLAPSAATQQRCRYGICSDPNSTFEIGKVCEGVDYNNNTIVGELLRGKHLIVMEYAESEPYAILNSDGTFSGFDIDLISWIAGELGFTYEIRHGGTLPPEINITALGLTYWDALLLYNSMRADVSMGNWFHNTRRMARGDPILLNPHLRMGPVLVRNVDPRALKPRSKSLGQSMLTPLDPFEALLWLTLFGMVATSGILFVWLEAGIRAAYFETARR